MKALGRLGRGVLAGVVLAIGAVGLAGCDKPAEKPVTGAAPAASGTSQPGNADAASGGQPAASGAAAASGPAKGDPIKIGHYASITGSEATFGISTDNGIKLAVEERNAAGGVKGRPIQLITYDNQGKQQETTTVVTRLVQQDKVVALLGEVATSRSLVGGPIAQKAGIPMITPSSTNVDVTAIGDMVFRVCFIDPFQAYAGAKFATDNMKKTKCATLYNRAQAYSEGLNRDFIESFKQMGGTVATQQAYGDGDNDFSAQLAAIKEANVEFIYVPGYYTEVVNIAKQARKLGLTIPLLGGDGWDSVELKNAGDSLDGCFFTNHYAKEEQRPEVQAFVEKYTRLHKDAPDGLAALGYDAARLLFDSMEAADSLDGKAIAAKIAGTKGFPGVTGLITIDEERNASKDAVVLEITNGVPRYVATIPKLAK